MKAPTTKPQLPIAHNGNLKVAIVCDWLTGIGGAERVVLELHKLYPDAPIYTSQYSPNKLDWFKDADVRTGWLQRIPAGLKKFLPVLRAWYFSHLDLSDYDLVISSSGAEAKGVRTGNREIVDSRWVGKIFRPWHKSPTAKRPLHICYCHSPTHYYWIRYDEYIKHPGFGRFDPMARIGLKLLVGPLKRWDFKAAQRPDVMIANSTHTQTMIQQYYQRESTVIHPPVDTERFRVTGTSPLRHGFVTAGRQTPYMRKDLAVQACTELDVPLVVIGSGPDHDRLKKLAGRSVVFLTNVSDEEMASHFQSALGFIFPGMEDFGITAVEAMAAGTPVIAFNQGGSQDSVVAGQTGVFFEEQTVASLVKALQDFKPDKFDHAAIRQHAEQFSVATFHKHITKFIEKNLARSATVE